MSDSNLRIYRGRIAPTPTGYLHLGHARTFLEAQRRAREAGGALLMRIEDLDHTRCKEEFVSAAYEDLRWAGLEWDEGRFVQSERIGRFRVALAQLREMGFIYPCFCSRKDVALAVSAPHEEGRELIYPGTCRDCESSFGADENMFAVNWRFRVPDGEMIAFADERMGNQGFVAGEEFGDFLVWRKDGIPAYELAVVVDDIEMAISEVVRGEDLLMSTARQILLYRAFGGILPKWYHCSLVLDEKGKRLAKRDKAMGLRALRERGMSMREFGELVANARIAG